ncbi:MAG: aldo/keto reductase [Caulobacteraceae bacterium]
MTLIWSDLEPSRVGLGCSRFGSMTQPMTQGQAHALVGAALDAGVNLFDTANIYGQGDSERWLGAALKGKPAFVCSKAGQVLPTRSASLRLIKTLLGPMVRSVASLQRKVLDRRSAPYPVCFEPEHLRTEAQASLRRLGRDRIDGFFLHNPDIEVLARGDAVEALDDLRQQGDIGLLGLSTDEAPAAFAAMADPRIRLLQLPLELLRRAPEVGVAAKQAGVGIVVREIFGGFAPGGARVNKDTADAIIAETVGIEGVTTALVGTCKVAHLLQAARAADRATSSKVCAA